jgi:diaminopimelate epimerase
LQFVKMHGAGNDFVLLDLLKSGDDRGDAYWSELAVAMCDRHFGIGSDGLLLVVPSEVADARMRMFNPDGSESASCGNGIRCLGRYVRDHHGIGNPALRVETGAGVTTITTNPDGSVTVDMGPPIFEPSRVPVNATGSEALDLDLAVDGNVINVACASMGNPHAITFLNGESLESYPLERVGPKVEHDAHFPARTNFEVVEVLAPDHLRVRVWERGAGITLACGTGACATVAVASRLGKVQPPVKVDLPGGQLSIDWDGQGSVFMTGPTAYVFTGEWTATAASQRSELAHVG